MSILRHSAVLGAFSISTRASASRSKSALDPGWGSKIECISRGPWSVMDFAAKRLKRGQIERSNFF